MHAVLASASTHAGVDKGGETSGNKRRGHARGNGKRNEAEGGGSRRRAAERSRSRLRLSPRRDLVAPVIGGMIYVAAGYRSYHFQRGAIALWEGTMTEGPLIHRGPSYRTTGGYFDREMRSVRERASEREREKIHRWRIKVPRCRWPLCKRPRVP